MQSASLRPGHGVRLHDLQDDAVLFDEDSQRLFHLNGAAACIWRHIDRGLEPALMAERVAETLAIDAASALIFLRDMTGQWADLRLLGDGRARPERPLLRPQATPHPARTTSSLGARTSRRRHYAALGQIIAVVFGDKELEDRAHPPLQHLEVPTSEPPELAILVRAERGRYEIRCNGRRLGSCSNLSGVAPLLSASLFHLAVQRFPHVIALHAGAAASSSEDCLLLPAASGSGKSTLTAGLVHGGWRYLADDIVLLEQGTLHAVGVPNALGLKTGVWRVLESRYPELPALPVHDRSDGRRVRYATPSRYEHPKADKGLGVRWIVFPRYASGRCNEMHPLSSGEGLCRLMAHCSGLPGRLTQEHVQAMVRWIRDVACFDLRFSDLDVALGVIHRHTAGIMGKGGPIDRSAASN